MPSVPPGWCMMRQHKRVGLPLICDACCTSTQQWWSLLDSTAAWLSSNLQHTHLLKEAVPLELQQTQVLVLDGGPVAAAPRT